MDVAIVVLVPQGRPNVEDAPKPHPDLPPGWGLGLVGQRKKGRPDGRPPQGRCHRFAGFGSHAEGVPVFGPDPVLRFGETHEM